MTLDEIFEHGKDFAKLAFNEQGHVVPMWIIQTTNETIIPVVIPFKSREDKVAAIAAFKEVLKSEMAVRYVSLVEAWLYEGKKGESVDDIMAAGPISEHPKRQEVIYLMAEDKYHNRSGCFYIIRPDVGRPRLSDFDKHPDDLKFEGTFSNLLESADAIH